MKPLTPQNKKPNQGISLWFGFFIMRFQKYYLSAAHFGKNLGHNFYPAFNLCTVGRREIHSEAVARGAVIYIKSVSGHNRKLFFQTALNKLRHSNIVGKRSP